MILARCANQSPQRLCTFPQSPAPHSSCQSPSLPSSMTIYHSLLRSFGAAASLIYPYMSPPCQNQTDQAQKRRRHCSCAGKGPPSPTQCSRHAHHPVREPPRSHVRETGFIAFVSEHVIQTPTRASITPLTHGCPSFIHFAPLTVRHSCLRCHRQNSQTLGGAALSAATLCTKGRRLDQTSVAQKYLTSGLSDFSKILELTVVVSVLPCFRFDFLHVRQMLVAPSLSR